MTTDDAVHTTTDLWGRPVHDGDPVLGPGDEDDWPASPMLVLGDDDVLACASGFCRAFSSEYFFTIWLLAVDEQGWTTKDAAELLDMPQRPPPSGVRQMIREAAAELETLSPGCSVVVAIADPDGGDRGVRELAWTGALLDAAQACGMRVRGVVAVGAHRARLLHSAHRPGDPAPSR